METRSRKRVNFNNDVDPGVSHKAPATEAFTSRSFESTSAKPEHVTSPDKKMPKLSQDNKEDNKINQTPVHTANDFTQLLTIFPEELWHHILENVDNATTYKKIGAASPLFRQLLKDHRTRVLFPQVARIMFNVYLHDSDSYGRESFGWSKDELVALRSVCRTWMRGVDTVLETPGFQWAPPKFSFGRHFQNEVFKHVNREEWCTCLDTIERLTNFEDHFELTHLPSGRNPFLTRYLSIRITTGNGEVLSEFLDGFQTFLGKYGSHLWYCSIEVNGQTAVQQIQFYKKLSSVLEHLPNLRVLKLLNSNDEVLSSGNISKIDNHLKSGIPTLPWLQYLQIKGTPNSVLRWLVGEAPQLDQLDVLWTMQFIDGFLKFEKDTKFCMEQIPNLKKLSLWIESQAEFENFANANAICNLEKLKLFSYNCYVPWKQIFAALEKHGGQTLTSLTLELPNAEGTDVWEILNLPKLQNLQLRLDKPVPLDFLLPMKENLEELNIVVGMEEWGMLRGDDVVYAAIEQEKVVMFYTHYELREWEALGGEQFVLPPILCVEVYRSNLWNLFGKMRRVEFEINGIHEIFTRKEWNEFQSKILPEFANVT